MAKRKQNQGRNYPTSEWLRFMLEGEIESQAQAVRDGEHELSRDCYGIVRETDSYDVAMTSELIEAKEGFEQDVQKAIEEWAKEHPLYEDVSAEDIMVDGAPGDVFLTLDGSGAGSIWDGQWNDEYFADGDKWEPQALADFMEKKVGKYVDDTGSGDIPIAMSNAVYATFDEMCSGQEENPRKSTKKLKAKLLR